MIRALVLGLAVLAAPARAQDAVPPQTVLVGAEWVLTELDGKPVTGPRPPTLTMTMAGAIAGFSGCNRYFGQLLFAENGAVSASSIGMTRMACPQKAMALEAGFARALQGVTEWRHASGIVSFDGNGGALRFQRK